MRKTHFYLDQRGCAKNQVDGEEIGARLEAAGHVWVDQAEEADLVIVNSCGFIEAAKKESLGAVLEWKTRYPGMKILLAGCLAQRYATELAEGLPEVDGIVGNADLSAMIRAVDETVEGKRPVLVPESRPPSGYYSRARLLDFPGTAHVKVTEGCSNNCTYCAIPLIRGPLRSRPVDEALSECRELIARGMKELVLVGQDLGSYGRESDGSQRLPDLLEALSSIPGEFRIRTLYIHPDNFPRAILPIMKADPRILPYFDLPFQHASERILRAMNRRGSNSSYLELLAEIREALPDAVLRSTFLLGFPGETEEDFAILRDFQDRARLDWLGAFAYSREEGTAAWGMKNRVLKKTVSERKKAVEEAQVRITAESLARFVGRELQILVEENVEKTPGDSEGEELSLGRAWLQAPEVDGLTVLRGRCKPGSLVRAKILSVNGVDLDAAPLARGADEDLPCAQPGPGRGSNNAQGR